MEAAVSKGRRQQDGLSRFLYDAMRHCNSDHDLARLASKKEWYAVIRVPRSLGPQTDPSKDPPGQGIAKMEDGMLTTWIERTPS